MTTAAIHATARPGALRAALAAYDEAPDAAAHADDASATRDRDEADQDRLLRRPRIAA